MHWHWHHGMLQHRWAGPGDAPAMTMRQAGLGGAELALERACGGILAGLVPALLLAGTPGSLKSIQPSRAERGHSA